MAWIIFKFNQGDEVKDQITGYKGIITGRTDWFNGCSRYMVESKKLKEDGTTNELWFDEPRLILLKEQKVVPQKTKQPHGPRGTKNQY